MNRQGVGLGLKFMAAALASTMAPFMAAGFFLALYRQDLSVPIALAVAALAAVIAALGAGYSFQRLVLHPLNEMKRSAELVAGGDFSRMLTVKDDELGELAGRFNEVAGRVSGLLDGIKGSTEGIIHAGEDISARCRDVISSSDTQMDSVETVLRSIKELNDSIRDIAENILNVMDASVESAASVNELATSIENVSGNASELSESVVEGSSAIDSMAISIMETAQGIDSLAGLAGQTNSELDGIQRSLREVEASTRRSVVLSEEVAADAESGMQAVQQTMAGMERIRRVVGDSAEVVRRLGLSTKYIDEIIKVIDEVTDKTNLLALNAAIIAAQAGEQGRSFAVVADEIKGLAERTGNSTKEIIKIIKSVQKEASEAADSMELGRTSVEEGVALSKKAGEALGKIIDSAVRSREVAGEIAKATAEQVGGVQRVSRSVSDIAGTAGRIAGSTQAQSRAAEGVTKASSRIKELSMQLRRATVEQAKGSRQINQAVESVSLTTADINRAIVAETAGVSRIRKLVEVIKANALGNVDMVARMNEGVEVLTEKAGSLKKKVM